MKKKILVTGGTGYIGSHTSIELISAGFDVVIIDNLSNSDVHVLGGIEKITGVRPEFEKVEMCDKSEMKAFFKQHNDICAVIHFAALKAVGESVENPLLYYGNNLGALCNLLNEMVMHKTKNIVFSSSCTIYGEPEILPVTENSPVKAAVSPYGNTKQISEEILSDTVHAHKINAISLRYFNPVGAHESAVIGELPLGVPNNLVPFITQTAAGVRDQLKVFGNDYNTPDGTCIRDYINIMDLAEAHVLAVKRMLGDATAGKLEKYNLGTGTGVSVLEIIEGFRRATGVEVKYRITGRREGDVEKVWADPSLAKKILGWEARRSLEETLLSAWRWEQNYRSGINAGK
ncbi:MAG: UDP-glucose 4-epimerase GalE [Bacteroidota bacterium]